MLLFITEVLGVVVRRRTNLSWRLPHDIRSILHGIMSILHEDITSILHDDILSILRNSDKSVITGSSGKKSNGGGRNNGRIIDVDVEILK